MTPKEIRAIPWRGGISRNPLSYPKGSGLRIVGTGHRWMRPGYITPPEIAAAAGLEQRLRTNTRGSEEGGARMMWDFENGLLCSHGTPVPICMSTITTGEWDAMMWGSYYGDRPEYSFAWIDFCLTLNPRMELYFEGKLPGIKELNKKTDGRSPFI